MLGISFTSSAVITFSRKILLPWVNKLVNEHVYSILKYDAAFILNKEDRNSSEGATLNVGLQYSVLYKSVSLYIVTYGQV
jgi:hypothetical protein